MNPPRRAGWSIPALVLAVASGCAPRERDVLIVQASGIAVELSSEGKIAGLRFPDGHRWRIGGDATLTNTLVTREDSCELERQPRRVGDGGVEVVVRCVGEAGEATRLTQQFLPGTAAIDWSVKVEALGDTSYTRGIWTRLFGWEDVDERRFWTAWGETAEPRNENPRWSDPLEPHEFQSLDLPYGGNAITRENGFSLPIATVLEPDTDHGLSLIQSPRDTLLDMGLRTSPTGDISLARFHNRIGPDRPVTFHLHLVPHAADWRPGVAWLVRHYREFFAPSSTRTGDVVGLSAYSSQRAPFDSGTAAQLDAMGLGVNWDATFDWPYLGMFLPPVGEAEEWIPFGTGWRERTGEAQSDDPERVGVQSLRDVAAAWRQHGFYPLAYFNTTEFGTGIGHPRPPPALACDAPDLWRSPNDYLYCNLQDALLRGPDGAPLFTWEGAVVMDPGEPVYRDYLLNQARRLLDQVPEYAGINIDRLDWLTQYNPWRDDGVSWFRDGPARSLAMSWKELLADLARVVHDRGKVLYVSPTTASRLDWMRHVDGFFGEYVSGDVGMNMTAFLGIEKPVMGWTFSSDWDRGGPHDGDPDRYLQSHLHMGVMPMAPVARNDHGIRPSDELDAAYLAYGALFRALRGRRWVLEPHAVAVQDGRALANIFEVDGGIAVPVTFGANVETVTLAVRWSPLGPLDWARARYTVPGVRGVWRPLAVRRHGDVALIDVPLERGSALVYLPHPSTPSPVDPIADSSS